MAESKKARFEVTIRYKDRRKNWVKVVECENEFIVDMANDEDYIKIRRVQEGEVFDDE